jgi:hypothetical protein
MEQYLLHDKLGYYWIWYRGSKDERPNLNGPHSEKMINLPVIEVDNPISFKPKEAPDVK